LVDAQLQPSSPGLTGRSSNHRPGVLDCPVKPGNDPDGACKVAVGVRDGANAIDLTI
jgi:hypothetical protein